MKYRDSSCTFERLQRTNSFRIDRHALRIIQPIKLGPNNTYILDCYKQPLRWGRIDYSKGFMDWWYLSHIDFHVPSEHTQEGKRYDAEIQMYHFYSVSDEQAGIGNEVRTTSDD